MAVELLAKKMPVVKGVVINGLLLPANRNRTKMIHCYVRIRSGLKPDHFLRTLSLFGGLGPVLLEQLVSHSSENSGTHFTHKHFLLNAAVKPGSHRNLKKIIKI